MSIVVVHDAPDCSAGQ